MKKLLLLSAMVLITNAKAFDLPTYAKVDTSKQLTVRQLSDLFSGNTPVCVKLGRKIISANKAFNSLNTSAKIKKTLCSGSDKAKAYQQALGVDVTVLKDSNLPSTILKKLIAE